MKFFLEDDTSRQVNDILISLKKLMDGDVSSQMKQKGIKYNQIYGTSIYWLRKMAKQYSGKNNLANRLWHRQIRETMILATLIAEPDKSFITAIDEWTETLITNEIAEQFGTNLLWKIPDLYDYSCTLLKSENTRKSASAWAALSTFIQRGGTLNDKEVSNLLSYIKNKKYSEDIFIQRTTGRFLRQLCRTSKDNLKRVEELLNNLKSRKELSWLIEDVETEIQFLKESE